MPHLVSSSRCPSEKKTTPPYIRKFRSKTFSDSMTSCRIASKSVIGLKKGIEAFDKYTLWALNYAAVSNICQLGGRYREGPIRGGNHLPPLFIDWPKPLERSFPF